MKDIDERLTTAHKLQPRRTLSPHFTDATMAEVHAASQRHTSLLSRIVSNLQGFIAMHKLAKPAALAIGLVIVVITAGTGYATLKWLQPNSTLDKNSITTLPNGNIRFWIHSDSCQGQDMEHPVDSYYEIKAGSKVTPEDLRHHIEASCEDDLLAQLFPETRKAINFQNFKSGEKQYFLPWVEIKAISNQGVRVQSGLNGHTYPETTLPLDKNVRIYEKGQKIALSDLKPGDWVTLVSYTTALDKPFSTETMTDSELETLMENGFPKGTRVAGLIRHQYNPIESGQRAGVMGEDWTRLVEDKNSPDGWRQLVPFDRDWNKYEESYQKQ